MKWRVSLRSWKLRHVPVSRSLSDDCIRLRHHNYLYCFAGVAVSRNAETVHSRSELFFTQQAIFVFPLVAGVLQRSFWAAQLFILSQRFSVELKSFHAGPRVAFETKYQKRACLTACPIYYFMKHFILGIYISVKFHKKTSHSHARTEAVRDWTALNDPWSNSEMFSRVLISLLKAACATSLHNLNISA